MRLLFTGEAIMTAPGALHELEHAIINNRIYRVYKNLWPSLRAFWIDRITQNTEVHNQEYLVFEDTRITCGQADKIIHKLASILYEASIFVFFFDRVLHACFQRFMASEKATGLGSLCAIIRSGY